ncbi:MAG: glycosyltransferase [Nannocystaceae bacterium]
MKIALATSGTLGDVLPVLILGQALRDRGHSVSVCASEEFRGIVGARDLRFEPIGIDMDAWLGAHAVTPATPWWRRLRLFREFWRDELAAQVAGLRRAAAGADRVVGTAALFATGPVVAEAVGAEYVHLVLSPLYLRSRHHPPWLLPWARLPRPIAGGAWAATERAAQWSLGPLVRGIRRELGLAAEVDLFAPLSRAPHVVAVEPTLAPVPPDVAVRHVVTGPLIDGGDAPLDAALGDFLERGPAPIYAGFGSMSDPDPARTTATLVQAARAVGSRLVIARGRAGLGEGLVGGAGSGEVLVVDAAPHRALLPRVAVAIHHGGAGTTIAAARAGVPQIVVPHAGDQGYFGDRVRRLGIGPAPLRRPLRLAELVRALGACDAGGSIGAAARRLGPRVREGDGAAAAVAAIEGVRRS